MPPAVLAVALALLLLTSACGREGEKKAQTGTDTSATTKEPEPKEENLGPWATPEELRWLRKFGTWAGELNAGVAELDAIAGDRTMLKEIAAEDEAALAEFDVALELLRRCDETFARRVGEAPTSRTEEAAELAVEACVHYQRVAEAMRVALVEDDKAKALEAKTEGEQALELVTELNKTLPPGEAQPLPVVDKPSTRSRVNPRFGDAVEALVDLEMEVRCWSKRDWPRLLAEERAFTRRKLPLATTAGVTGIGSSRINLAPVACEILDRFAYRGYRPAGDDIARVAAAVGLLAHEAQHRALVADEPTAECYGMQLAGEAAQALGATKAYAASLETTLWAMYPTIAKGYRSPECRNGGKLDLDPKSDRWP